MSLRFKGKNVLIIGAGRATAILFANEGARVVAVDMTDEFGTAEMHPGVASLRGDAGSESDLSTMMKLAAQRTALSASLWRTPALTVVPQGYSSKSKRIGPSRARLPPRVPMSTLSATASRSAVVMRSVLRTDHNRSARTRLCQTRGFRVRHS
jgi:NAD(P)-dependent dehydrogenase (short-subunit alcohol dehydrogenase family)